MHPNGEQDMRALVERSQRLQRQMVEAQAAMAEAEVTGRAGDQVSVTFAATGEPRGVSIDAAAVDPDDVAGLERLVLAALADASAKMRSMAENMLGPVTDFFGRVS